MEKKRIIAAGYISLDMTPTFEAKEDDKTSYAIQAGKLIKVDRMKVHLGGSVSNTGLALHKLGSDVLLMGKIGDDEVGKMMKDRLVETKCPTQILEVAGESTSYTIVIAPPKVDRIFFAHSGANDTFNTSEMDFEKIGEYDHFHFGYPTLMENFYLDDGVDLVRLYKKLKEMGLTTSLDMAAIDPTAPAGKCDWKSILKKVLPYVDFFVPSIEELGYMLRPELYDEWQIRAAGGDITELLSLSKDIKPLAEDTLALGCKVVLIKCGIAGMYLQTQGEDDIKKLGPSFTKWANIEHFESSYKPDRVRSAVGAGDSSIAAFIKAVLEDYSPYEALQFATGTGSLCVTAYDSLSALQGFEELKEKIDKGWEKQNYINP